jgi:hypothetical protein
MLQKKLVVEIKTHILFFINFSSDNRAIFEIMRKNMVELDRPQIKVSRMRMSSCVPVATNTQTQYVILIASALQQLLCEPPSVLHSLLMLLNILLYIFFSDFVLLKAIYFSI